MKCKGANFACVCVITLSNGFYKKFFPIRSLLFENGKTGFFCFNRVGEQAHISKIFYLICSRGSVAHSFNLLHNVRDRTTEITAPNRRQRFESSSNQSVFNFFFSIRFTCSRSLFSFANILYFTWLILFDLILL